MGFLSAASAPASIIHIFSDYRVMGEEKIIVDGSKLCRQILIPSWWSSKMLDFIIDLEHRVQTSVLSEKVRGPKRTLRPLVPSSCECLDVP